ncbi:family 16 glycosylhydrolase [Novosphingobium cyanobacteriorum]|uniref:Family 16 glycosylhydrolase n=1 Tax=Novosphingobium cyanobacteriorum TaxID=3024215 RepID=A0ABT6CM69_9SPHN|nr:family 16 glycosylhydrolase [Novosphingobium cyanobacteriorum]MDF8335008.1 family 16 glycosylhydrolase [Novosphingobium cyanobacteriorum]
MPLASSGSPTNIITGTALGEVLMGTSGNDAFYAFGTPNKSSSTLVGGLGDDSYYVHSTKDFITEKPGEGTDTAYADFTYSLPAYVENLVLVGNLPIMGIGNGGNNIIKGNGANNVLEGLTGADELTGGGGNDVFTVQGNDTIMDFTSGDRVNLYRFGNFQTFEQVKAVMTQSGANVVMKLSSADTITFKNFNINNFTADNFLLSTQTSGYTQTFGDDFDTFSVNTGTGSTGNWYQLFPRSGIAAHSTVDHGSIQYFTFPGDIDAFGNPVTINPFTLNDGVLSISMDRIPVEEQPKFSNFEYSSGMINSVGSFSQTYGYFEIRAKLPAGQGLHDAFWLLPMDGGWPPELDIVEQRGGDPTKIINVAHGLDENGDRIAYGKQLTVPTATTEFHTYGLDWEPDYLTWYVDGVAQWTMPTLPGMDKPMYMIANIGSGGPWSGDPDSTTPFPASMEIDYIRVYSSKYTVEKGVAVDKVGTDASEEIFGTNFNDTLNGGLGDDQLYGGAGDDTLTGGGGNVDILEGGFGNDTYLVLTTADEVMEGLNRGIDTVKTTLSSYTLDNNVENLLYIGNGSHSLFGNGLDNYIQGGDQGGLISGWGGNDTMQGGLGVDQLNGGDGNDIVRGGGGADTLRGNDGDDRLFGDEGDDLVKGDAGNDYLEGGAGNDNLQGNDGDDVIYGGDGADSIDGGTGNDTLYGGSGNDTYFVDHLTETIIENAGEGNADLVKARLDQYTLADQVENLNYVGTGNFVGTGNALANKIVGGAGTDILDGAGGADMLTGAGGDDTFSFTRGEADGDKILDFQGAGAPGGDRISFIGYGLDGTITQIGTSDFYLITAGQDYGYVTETIQIVGVFGLSSDEYVFLPPVNHAPTDIVLTGGATSESASLGTVIGTLSTDDPDVAEVNSYVLTDSAGGMFKIVGDKLVLAKPLDFENQASYQVTVRVTDSAGHSIDKVLTVAVQDVNDNAPIITSSAAVTASENQTDAVVLAANDLDTTGETISYSIEGGDDAALFKIEGGVLKFISAPDFENAGHGPTYSVSVRASDGVNSSVQALTVIVADVKAGDTLLGSAFDDQFTYTPTLTYDRVDGLSGTDVLNLGANSIGLALAGGDVKFELNASGATDFAAAGIEQLNLTGQSIVLKGDLAGSSVTDLRLNGTAGNDAFDASVSSLGVNVKAGLGNDTILTGSGNDTLDGGGGDDAMTGGSGDDTYVVDSLADTVTENAGGGYDRVLTSLGTYTLAANVEVVTYTGTTAFSVKGNALDNVLTGSKGADRLEGLAGVDTMIGGLGSDTYTVENINDVVVEKLNEGTDRVISQISYILPDNVENLTLATSFALNGTGNALANTIVGNSGANVLDGRGGADTLTGGNGNDVFVLRNGEAYGDVVTDFAGAGASGGDILSLQGYGTGAYISHAAGSDIYVIHAGSEFPGMTETIRLTGVTNLGAGDYLLDGVAGPAPITEGTVTPPDPGTGGDHMGDDVYIVTSSADVPVELVDGGYDVVKTTLTPYVLGANIEALHYTGTSSFTGTGNALDNMIVGGTKSDKLDGGLGADTLIGGAGSDTYTVDNVGDVVVEKPGEGTDRVISKISYTLTDNVDKLTLSGSASVNGTGNTLANTLGGNSGANVLDGRGGADVLTGGSGIDTFVFQQGEAGGDRVTDFSGAGVAGGDVLRFVGYGADAYLTHDAGTDLFVIHAGSEYGGFTETIKLTGVFVDLAASDYVFI